MQVEHKDTIFIDWDRIEGLAFANPDPDSINTIGNFRYTDSGDMEQQGDENTLIRELSHLKISSLLSSTDTISFDSDVEFNQFQPDDIIRIDKSNTTDFFDILNAETSKTRFIFSLSNDFNLDNGTIGGRIVAHPNDTNNIDNVGNTSIAMRTDSSTPTSKLTLSRINNWQLFLNHEITNQIYEISPHLELAPNAISINNTINGPIDFISTSLYKDNLLYVTNNASEEKIFKIQDFGENTQNTTPYLPNFDQNIVSLFDASDVHFITNESGKFFLYRVNEGASNNSVVSLLTQPLSTVSIRFNQITGINLPSFTNNDIIKIGGVDDTIYTVQSANNTTITLDKDYKGANVTNDNITLQRALKFTSNSTQLNPNITTVHKKGSAVYFYDDAESLYKADATFPTNNVEFVKTFNHVNFAIPMEMLEYEKETILCYEDGHIFMLENIDSANADNISKIFIGRIAPATNRFKSAFSIPPNEPYFQANSVIIDFKTDETNAVALPDAITVSNNNLTGTYGITPSTALGNTGLTYHAANNTIQGEPTEEFSTDFVLSYETNQASIDVQINAKPHIEQKRFLDLTNASFPADFIPTNCYIYTHSNIFDKLELTANDHYTAGNNTISLPIQENVFESLRNSGDYTLFLFSDEENVVANNNVSNQFDFIEQQTLHRITNIITGTEGNRFTISPAYEIINNRDSSAENDILNEGTIWKAANTYNIYDNIII